MYEAFDVSANPHKFSCNKLIMKIVQISFIHKFRHFTHEFHALKTHLTHE
jgi:hypothetical protein